MRTLIRDGCLRQAMQMLSLKRHLLVRMADSTRVGSIRCHSVTSKTRSVTLCEITSDASTCPRSKRRSCWSSLDGWQSANSQYNCGKASRSTFLFLPSPNNTASSPKSMN